MNVNFFIKWLLKSSLLVIFSVPIMVDALYRKRLRLKSMPVTNKIVDGEHRVIYFDRQELDPTADAGARTMFDVLNFLRAREVSVRTVNFSGWSKSQSGLKVASLVGSVVAIMRHIRNMRRSLQQCDFILVMSPGNYFIVLLLLLFVGKSPAFWFYGGDVYHERFKTGLKGSSGLIYMRYFLNYISYFGYESLLWPTADACLSPNVHEANLIRRSNPNSFVLPIRIFTDFELRSDKSLEASSTSDIINYIFIGGAGHSPNIAALRYAVTTILPGIKKRFNQQFKLHIVGSGWNDSEFSSWITFSPDCVIHGRVTDIELSQIYSKCLFSLAPIQDGAGVKGKVIEAMHRGVVVLTTPIGAQGIPPGILPRFSVDDELYCYIGKIMADSGFRRETIEKYKTFLAEYYSPSVYEDLFNMLLLKRF